MLESRVAVAHPGARKHYQEPILFHQWGVLERFYTDFYAGHSPITELLRHPILYHRIPGGLKKALDRFAPELRQAPVTHFPKFGYQYIQKLKQVPPQDVCRVSNWAGKEFCRHIIHHGLGKATIVYGFPTSSLELFEVARKQGLRCILDQVIAERSLTYTLVAEEEERWSDWSLTPFSIKDAERELIQREHQEQALADHIVCGSEFVKDSLLARGIDAEKISVVALGRLKDEAPVQRRTQPAAKRRGDALKILFAGAAGLRKGIPDLLSALKQLKGSIPITCKIAGSIEIKLERVAEYSDVCEFLGRVPRSQMAALYQWADVFVLPSICEGSAMVIYEALLYGLPVITTYNAGSLVRDGIDGSIVNIRDPDAIASKLVDLYETGFDRDAVKHHTYLAETFQGYEATLHSLISSISVKG